MTKDLSVGQSPPCKGVKDLPAIWRVQKWTPVHTPDGPISRYDEVIYDETPGYVGCTVRSWLSDGYVDWDYVSTRYMKSATDGGWVRAA